MATSQPVHKGRSQRNRRKGGGGNRGGNPNNRNYSRNRSSQGRNDSSRSRSRKAPEPTFGQKLLSIVTFGKLGKPAPARPSSARKKSPQKETPASRQSMDAGARAGKRTPEVVEVTSERLYVGNLSYDAAESDLIELFTGVGQVTSAEVVSHRRTQRSKGYAFVEMNTLDEARRAVEVLHDKDFMGRKLVVSGAKSPGVRESDSNGDSPQD